MVPINPKCLPTIPHCPQPVSILQLWRLTTIAQRIRTFTDNMLTPSLLMTSFSTPLWDIYITDMDVRLQYRRKYQHSRKWHFTPAWNPSRSRPFTASVKMSRPLLRLCFEIREFHHCCVNIIAEKPVDIAHIRPPTAFAHPQSLGKR